MNLRQIQDIAGHRNLPPWVIKLVQDCIEHDRTYENQDLTLAYMTGFEKGKDYMKEKAAKVCEEKYQSCRFDDYRDACQDIAAAIRSMK